MGRIRTIVLAVQVPAVAVSQTPAEASCSQSRRFISNSAYNDPESFLIDGDAAQRPRETQGEVGVTREEIRGRRIVLSIAMCWSLYVGYRWARAYVPATFLLSGLLEILRAYASTRMIDSALRLVFAAGFIVAAFVLWTAPSVAAHFASLAGPRETV